MPSDSKLHVSFSKNSSNSKPPIYEKQMERKREKLLKKDEYIKEDYKGSEVAIEGTAYSSSTKEKILKENEETRRLNKEMRDNHNDRIKRE